ncbi:helicase associated domain-containing protein [Streptomyces sp. NPDC054783]
MGDLLGGAGRVIAQRGEQSVRSRAASSRPSGPPPRSQPSGDGRPCSAVRWAAVKAGVLRCREREGHLRVPRKHIETIVGEDQEQRQLRLGAWIGNQRSRAASLSPEGIEQLSAIGMRWA